MTEDKKVVVGKSKKGGRLIEFVSRRKVLLAGAVLLLLLGLGIVSWYLYVQQKDGSAVVKLDTSAYDNAQPTTLDAVNGLIAAKQYDQALVLLDAQKPADSHEVMGLRGIVQYSKGDYQAVLANYAAIEGKYGPTASEAAYAGRAAEKLQQYQQALTYFEKAKQVASAKDDPMREVNVAEYQSYIDRVRKEQ